MHLKPNLKLRHVKDDFLIVDQNEEAIDLTYLYQMSPAAAYLWEKFYGKDFTIEMMREALCNAYEVCHEMATHDLNEMLNQWEAYGLLIR